MSRIRNQSCKCGSQTEQLIDLSQNRHTLTCLKHGHSSELSDVFAPNIHDLFCECGGLFIPTVNDAFIPGSGSVEIPVMKQFFCPSCSIQWSFLSMPKDARNATEPSIEMEALLESYTHIQKYGMDEELGVCVHILRNYSNQNEFKFMSKIKSIFGINPQKEVPPNDMPEKVAFLNWVKELKSNLKSDGKI